MVLFSRCPIGVRSRGYGEDQTGTNKALTQYPQNKLYRPLPTLHMGKPTHRNPDSSDGRSYTAPSTVAVMTSLSLSNQPPTSAVGAFVWRCRMWFECTFAFTMLEPWEKILCGEYAGIRRTPSSFERFHSFGVYDSVPARRHRFRPILPPARQDDVRQGNVLLVRG